jgi:hypothetical protein
MGLKLDWRGFLVAAGASVMATSFSELPAVLVQQETRGLMKFESASVEACVFDTFGTVVDWRSSVIAEATNWGRVKGLRYQLGRVHRPLAPRIGIASDRDLF